MQMVVAHKQALSTSKGSFRLFFCVIESRIDGAILTKSLAGGERMYFTRLP